MEEFTNKDLAYINEPFSKKEWEYINSLDHKNITNVSKHNWETRRRGISGNGG